MNKLLSILILLVILAAGFYAYNTYTAKQKQANPSNSTKPTDKNTTDSNNTDTTNTNTDESTVQVIPISHATVILKWGDKVIYADPTGEAKAFVNQPKPDIIVVTDVHGDHLSTTTLESVIGDAVLIVPQAVKDLLPATLASKAKVLANGETTTALDFEITAIPMYNLPESVNSKHPKGRGNGYVIERDGFRVYDAGDTSATLEMKALKGIDIAFLPMNEPTMTVEEAADAVTYFEPKQVYPFHYRSGDGLSDINKFKELVEAGTDNTEVILLNWYPSN